MKKLAVFSLLAVAAASQAALNFNLDFPDLSAPLPTSGTTVLTFTGTVDVTAGWDATSATLNMPFQVSSFVGLAGAFDPGFVAYLSGANAGVDYSGNIFSIDVTPSSAIGLYDSNFNSTTAATITVSGQKGVSTFDDSEAYSVEVTAVPEPASLIALGAGAAALIRRRKRA